jgi:anti-sigma factor RsiW
MAGDRPAHLDRCDICADRALELGRWMDDVRAVAEADIDVAFPAERLAAQQSQIMRKLEQLDQPSRVIAFPKHIKLDSQTGRVRGIAPGWLAVAAAAGLILGVAGSQVSSRFTSPPVTTTAEKAPAAAAQQVDEETIRRVNQVDQDASGRVRINSIEALDQATPTFLPESQSQQNSIILAALTTPTSRRDK